MAGSRNTFWVDALLVVVTLGFYMPYWFWRRNADLRADFPKLGLQDNLWLLAGGTLVSLAGTLTGILESSLVGSALTVAGILLFSAGVFLLLRNGEEAAEAERTPWRVPPALGGGLFAAAFVAIEAGNVLPSMLVRGPALLLLASLPFVFYHVHEDLEGVHEARAKAPPPAAPLTS